jgi:hypothetical protein
MRHVQGCLYSPGVEVLVIRTRRGEARRPHETPLSMAFAPSRGNHTPMFVPESERWRPVRSEPYHCALVVSLVPEIKLQRAARGA